MGDIPPTHMGELMKRREFNSFLLVGIAMAWAPAPARSQEVPAAAGAEADAGLEEVVVTARRRSETLQDVPQTVNAVSSETIEKLRINSAADIQQLVPGISIEGASSGSGAFGSSSAIRGVPTFLTSNATPVVQFYLNDAPTGRGPEVTTTLFDIGQIEVLKGPQGTLRGRSAPSGAITITTRSPDLDEVGGYVNVSGTENENINAQAAIGLPIVDGVLGFRLAGVIDHTDAGNITSVNNSAGPFARNEAVRGTLRFEPSPSFAATLMYQRLTTDSRTFGQVTGPGNGINGPAIAAADRRGITDQPNNRDGATDFFVGQADWHVAGQTLSYVGSYRESKLVSVATQDNANVIPGSEWFQTSRTPAHETSHELRLSSEERVAGMFDYTIGAFYDREKSAPTVQGTAAFLSGAFGRPGQAPTRGEPNTRYSLANFIDIDPLNEELSYFANLTAHLGERTEVSAGGRFLKFTRDERFSITTGSAFNAITNPLIPSPAACGFLPGVPAGTAASPVYTGLPAVCDIPIGPRSIQNLRNETEETPFVYNVSISHNFTPDFMVYANTGTAVRLAGPSIGIQGVTSCCSPPSTADLGSINDLIFHEPEDSTTYEIGFKSTFLERRVRLNVALFQQDYEDFFYLTQSTRYLSVSDPTNPAGGSVGQFEFTTNADAKTEGVDLEVGFQVTPRWSINGGFSWSEAELDDASVPCNDGNFDGTPDAIVPTVQSFINAGVLIARCSSDNSISRTPDWNATLQSEYAMQVSATMDGFVRGNFVYYPDNSNASEGFVVSQYGLLNMFAGIRSEDDAWEVAVFALNLGNTSQILSRNAVAVTSAGGASNFFPGASGYNSISFTPEREIGLSVRYAFGSR